ncbi:MAG: DUF4115 domain-containing protein [Gammaproteobacteria bacterium]|nr:DUF4115 domain-containing protein [Gammaproteobacteria bacterium]
MATLDRGAEGGGGSTALAGPGARLRARREGMGLSVEQVADKLRLDVRYIQALEQDNHGDIAAPVFVRGYLRSYAALLQLPADAIVECYAADDADTAALFDGPAQPKPKQRISAPELRWLIWIGIAGAALVVAAAVIFGGRIQGLISAERATQPVSPATTRTAADTGELSAQASGATASTTESADQASPEPQLSSGTTNKLVLRLSADSWVVISDASGKQLLYELMRGGSTRVLEGMQPPLQVVLGNSPAVTVEYNGTLFDQSRFNSNGVARFALGADAR